MTFAALTQQGKQVHYAIISAAHAEGITRSKRACTQILLYSQVSEEPPPFQYLGDAALDDLRRVEAVNPLTIKENGTAYDAGFVNIQQPGNGAHDGRFAGAIGTKHRDHCLLRHLQ